MLPVLPYNAFKPSGGGGGGGGAPPTLTPPSGLVAWFMANTGLTQSGGNISSWADQSGNSNDAVQTNAAKKPIRQAAALNGLDTVLFDGQWIAGDPGTVPTQDYDNSKYFDLTASISLDTAFTIISVVRQRTQLVWLDDAHSAALQYDGQIELFGASGNSTSVASFEAFPQGQRAGENFMNMANANGGPYLYSQKTYLDFSKYHVFSGLTTQDASAGALYLDGHAYETFGSPHSGFSPATVLGQGDSTVSGMYLAEVLMWNRQLTDEERLAVEAYLVSKWGITTYNGFEPGQLESTITPNYYWSWYDFNDRLSRSAPVVDGLYTGMIFGNASLPVGVNPPSCLSAAQNGRDVAKWASASSQDFGTSFSLSDFNDPTLNGYNIFTVAKLPTTVGQQLSFMSTADGATPNAAESLKIVCVGTNSYDITAWTPTGVLTKSAVTIAPGFHLLTAALNGSSDSLIRVDGVSVGTLTWTPQDNSAGYWNSLGNDQGVYADMEIGELIILSGALGATDCAKLEGWLKAKWGTP